jgi:hypothetical protein
MKKLLLIIPILIIIFFTSCVSPFWNPPTYQEDALWLANEFYMFFWVNSSENMGTIGTWIDEDNKIEIKIDFDPAFYSVVYDNNEIIYSDRGFNPNNAILFGGDNRFRKNSFTITVTSSEIESIKVGDVITFNRVDELPGWAVVLEAEDE